jgi:hypothetical protein
MATWSCIRTARVRTTKAVGRTSERGWACGGVLEILGMFKPICTSNCVPLPYTSVRNIAERCPGDQTNNRAELIVCAFPCSTF